MAARTSDIAVAIATLDRPAGLARCLDAVLAGDALPAEIIVVDQSRDLETKQLLEGRPPAQVPLMYVRQQGVRGLSASRNAAIARAGSSIVAMTDDDCVPGPGWAAAIADAFTAVPGLVAVTGRILPLGRDTPGLYAVSSRRGAEGREYRGKVPPWRAASGGNFAVRKAWWQRLGGFDERLGAGSPGKSGEDVDFAYRLLVCGGHIRYDPAAIVYHERQEYARRMATRWGYGYGMGAFCGKWLRRGDTYALRLLAGWLAWRGREFTTAVAHGRWQPAQETARMLLGTLAGTAYGIRLAGDPRPSEGSS